MEYAPHLPWRPVGAKSIHATITHVRVTDFNRMIEETDCEQNERDPVVNGRFTTVTH